MRFSEVPRCDCLGQGAEFWAHGQRFTRPFNVSSHQIYTSVYPFDDATVDGLVKNADTAMYRAKERGRNTYQFFTADMNARANERLALESSLRIALEQNQFRLHYQPKLSLVRNVI